MRLGAVEYGAGQTDKALDLFDEALALNLIQSGHTLERDSFSDTKKQTEARRLVAGARDRSPV